MLELQTLIKCPECGHKSQETMPDDQCIWFYECKSCHVVLKPKKGDCCVFCSYATVPCPPVQVAWENGQTGNCCSDD